MLFLELIRVSLGRADRLSCTPTAEQWQELLDEAERQTLVGVLYPCLSDLPPEQWPPRKILRGWLMQTEAIRLRNKRLNRGSVWLTQMWASLGHQSIILKGQGNALLYPDPSLRASGDIDIWLDGKRRDIVDYVRKFFPRTEVTHIEMNFPVKKDVPIEIHFLPSFLYDPFKHRLMRQYFVAQFEKAREVKLPQAGTIRVPSDEMNLVFQLSHIYRHLFFQGIGLRQLMDYYYLLLSVGGGQTETAISAMTVIRRLGLQRFAEALMWVLGEVFLLEREQMLTTPCEKSGRFVLEEVLRAGNFGHGDSRVGVWTEMTHWEHFVWGTRWSWRLLRWYPREVLWHPFYRIAQYLWRRFNGYL